MRFFADLHIHSKYSRATSRNCDLENLAWWAQRKGLTVVGTGDFTHPAWWQEIQDKLVPAEPGLYRLRPEIEREVAKTLPASCRAPMRFMLEVEISTIYKKGDKTRKVHHLIYAASMETAGRFRDKLGSIGNIASDGRPILGLDSRYLLEITLESGPDAYLIPAHIWTPWFAAMGSKSGFDSIDDCYGDLAEHIFAVETGLSSDPPMNWRVSSLDRFTLVSNSDAHSPPMLGREASVFDCDLDYFAMRRALETGGGFGGTVEFFPEEGKYHLDGHRACKVRLEPDETRALGGRCPECGKAITVGVLHRVESLADRDEGERPNSVHGFESLVPLPEIAGEIHGVGPKTKTVARTLEVLTDRLGAEFRILFEQPIEDIERSTHPLVAEAIRRLRAGKVRAEGGYDGEFGTVRLFEEGEIDQQMALFAMPKPKPKPKPKPEAKPEPPRPVEVQENPESTDRPSSDEFGSVGLDADQQAAADVQQGPLLVVAGPGSGKTRTLTHRIQKLIEDGTPADQILAITFTRRAAESMATRVDRLLSAADRGVPRITTFHGLCLEILRAQHTEVELPPDFTIADDDLRLALAREVLTEAPRKVRARLRAVDARRRDRASDPALEPDDAIDADVARFRQALVDRGAADFDELLVRTVELLAENDAVRDHYRRRWPHISIDEYQDIDAVQYRLVRLLAPDAAGGGSLCAIGDPDQSIYAFRGADVSFFLRFRDDESTARVVELRRNYRSQATVVRAAAAVITPSTLVPDRHTESRSHHPARPIVTHQAASPRAEAEFVVHEIERLLGGTSYFSHDSGRVDASDRIDSLSFADFAVLYRTRAQAAPVVEALARAGMPFQERAHQRLLERDAVRLLLHEAEAIGEGTVMARLESAARRLRDAEPASDDEVDEDEDRRDDDSRSTDDHDLARALTVLGPLAEATDRDWSAFGDRLALGAEVDTWDPRAERISLLTLHAAKGLEFPVVFIVGCEDGLLPLRAFDGSVDEAEERRLFFVGMTRAEQRLHLSHARTRHVRGTQIETSPSVFLDAIDAVDRETRRSAPRAPKREDDGTQLRLL